MSKDKKPTKKHAQHESGHKSGFADVRSALEHVLADSWCLALKNKNFHWNVTGNTFMQLHEFFDGQYTELTNAADDLAERLRALGFTVPASLADFGNMTCLKDATGQNSAKKMLEQLLADHKKLREQLHAAIHVADDADDEGSEDLLIGRLRAHDKTIWMLKSLLA